MFYVWFSVFNLFSTMVFWALMADRFSLEQSKRIFGIIAVGGTLGAIFGPWLASSSSGRSARRPCCSCRPVFSGLAVVAAWLVAWLQPEVAQEVAEEQPGVRRSRGHRRRCLGRHRRRVPLAVICSASRRTCC